MFFPQLKVSYNYNAVQLLKKVHREILHPESTEKEPTGKAAGKKGDDKGKKAGKDKKEGGKGGKQPPSHGETPKESQTGTTDIVYPFTYTYKS